MRRRRWTRRRSDAGEQLARAAKVVGMFMAGRRLAAGLILALRWWQDRRRRRLTPATPRQARDRYARYADIEERRERPDAMP